MNLKKLPLHWKIIIGMILGVLFGFLMSNFEQFGKDFISDWLKPFGTILSTLWKNACQGKNKITLLGKSIFKSFKGSVFIEKSKF